MKKMYLLSSLSRPQEGNAGWPQAPRCTLSSERVLLQAAGFHHPHLVHLHQIGRLVSGLGGAGPVGQEGMCPPAAAAAGAHFLPSPPRRAEPAPALSPRWAGTPSTLRPPREPPPRRRPPPGATAAVHSSGSGGAGARDPVTGRPGAVRGASPSQGARCVRAPGCRFGLSSHNMFNGQSLEHIKRGMGSSLVEN
ncbi:serine/threonine-protein phosphatase 1 regulatory subunit 10-like [Delphinapterus leucas]|uniref:Serine/threonine-protein phosphatase 1 regulatory subunit 10-like n=1 Tax=Delphinapterus leucas TaxID=9749 RepID=A0A7F8KFV0_DELLE|nr:serine/threonine-protein phosphatase 1 regulatory subunit 10-like [Delphinapterus leucas]